MAELPMPECAAAHAADDTTPCLGDLAVQIETPDGMHAGCSRHAARFLAARLLGARVLPLTEADAHQREAIAVWYRAQAIRANRETGGEGR